VSLRETHAALREQLECLRQACYCGVLVEQTTEIETPIPGIFGLMTGFLGQLPKQPPMPANIFAFELKLLQELGLQPDAQDSRLSPSAQQLVKALGENDWPFVACLKLSGAQVTELRQFLHGYLIYHLGKIPPGRGHALQM
jgi:hypothetical protein